MRRHLAMWILLGLTAAVVLTGCGSSSDREVKVNHTQEVCSILYENVALETLPPNARKEVRRLCR